MRYFLQSRKSTQCHCTYRGHSVHIIDYMSQCVRTMTLVPVYRLCGPRSDVLVKYRAAWKNRNKY